MKAWRFGDFLNQSRSGEALEQFGLGNKPAITPEQIINLKLKLVEGMGGLFFVDLVTKTDVVYFDNEEAYLWYVLRWKL